MRPWLQCESNRSTECYLEIGKLIGVGYETSFNDKTECNLEKGKRIGVGYEKSFNNKVSKQKMSSFYHVKAQWHELQTDYLYARQCMSCSMSVKFYCELCLDLSAWHNGCHVCYHCLLKQTEKCCLFWRHLIIVLKARFYSQFNTVAMIYSKCTQWREEEAPRCHAEIHNLQRCWQLSQYFVKSSFKSVWPALLCQTTIKYVPKFSH